MVNDLHVCTRDARCPSPGRRTVTCGNAFRYFLGSSGFPCSDIDMAIHGVGQEISQRASATDQLSRSPRASVLHGKHARLMAGPDRKHLGLGVRVNWAVDDNLDDNRDDNYSLNYGNDSPKSLLSCQVTASARSWQCGVSRGRPLVGDRRPGIRNTSPTLVIAAGAVCYFSCR
jgi:hypothetical protein